MRAGWALIALAAWPLASACADTQGHVTGFGGVFVKSSDPHRLAAWYRDVLGVTLQPWGGASLSYTAPGHPAVVVWNAFPAGTDYFAPSKREMMIDFAVDNLDAMIARLMAKGVPVLRRTDDDANGRFAWIMDPDGTKIELREPKRR